MSASKTRTAKIPSKKSTSLPERSAAVAKIAAAAGKAPLSALDGSAPAPIAKPAVEPSIVEAAQPVILGPMMRKKELIDRVVSHSGMKKKDVKPVVESMLEVLGEALADKRELNLQPLGRLKVRREKIFPNGRMLVAKIRQNNASDDSNEDASDSDDEG